MKIDELKPGLVVLYEGERLVADFVEPIGYSDGDPHCWELYEPKDWRNRHGNGPRFLVEVGGGLIDLSVYDDELEQDGIPVGYVDDLVSTGHTIEESDNLQSGR